MLMAGAAYNLKKYLKFVQKTANSKVEVVKTSLTDIFNRIATNKVRYEHPIFW